MYVYSTKKYGPLSRSETNRRRALARRKKLAAQRRAAAAARARHAANLRRIRTMPVVKSYRRRYY